MFKPWGQSPLLFGAGKKLAPDNDETRKETEEDVQVVEDQPPEEDEDTHDRRRDEDAV